MYGQLSTSGAGVKTKTKQSHRDPDNRKVHRVWHSADSDSEILEEGDLSSSSFYDMAEGLSQEGFLIVNSIKDAFTPKFDVLSTSLETLETNVTATRTALTNVEERMSSQERRMDEVEKELKVLKTESFVSLGMRF